MKTIAIISASTPTDTNTGMQTVDMAAADLLGSQIAVKLSWFTFPSLSGYPPGPFHKEYCDDIEFFTLPESLEALYEHDLIIYWGDFLNSWTWYSRTGPIQIKELGLSDSDQKQVLRDCMLLASAPISVLRKTLVFGTTLLTDSHQALLEEPYRQSAERLIANCQRIWFRDPISAKRAEIIRGNNESCGGVDPAALLAPPLSDKRADSAHSKKRIAIFLGARTAISPEIYEALTELSAHESFIIEWLPWFPVSAPRKRTPREVISGWIRSAAIGSKLAKKEKLSRKKRRSDEFARMLHDRFDKDKQRSPRELRKQIHEADLVITDTYHVCINAWTLQTPTICLGLSQPNEPMTQSGSLNDIKKFILYTTYYARELYIPTDSSGFRDNLFAAIETAQSEATHAILKLYKKDSEQTKNDLIETCKKHLGL